jgi:thymidine kinase
VAGRPAEKGQLIMFLTGPGGSGKSEVTNQLLVHAKERCGKTEHHFGEKTILATACSGAASALVHGQTLRSATLLSEALKNIGADEAAKLENSVRMLIFDEVSLLSPSEIQKLNQRLNKLMETRNKKCGGVGVAFMGDF